MNTYVFKINDFKNRICSRSGGFFFSLAKHIINNGGIVYGVALENNIKAKHIRIDTIEMLSKIQGSKYIQSDVGKCYKSAKIDLDSGKTVLFSGTACQVAGLKTFLNKKYSNLVTVDIICHGVPSPMVWRDYLKSIEKKQNSEIVKVDFRNKYKFGWAAHKETVYFADGHTEDSGLFTGLFYSHNILRPCCYYCPYKSLERISDFSIGDAWGIDIANPEFNDDNGVSLILVNDKRAEAILGQLKDCEKVKVSISDYMQPPLERPFAQPKERKKFWNYYHTHSFEKVVSKYKRDTYVRLISNKLRKRIGRG